MAKAKVLVRTRARVSRWRGWLFVTSVDRCCVGWITKADVLAGMP